MGTSTDQETCRTASVSPSHIAQTNKQTLVSDLEALRLPFLADNKESVWHGASSLWIVTRSTLICYEKSWSDSWSVNLTLPILRCLKASPSEKKGDLKKISPSGKRWSQTAPGCLRLPRRQSMRLVCRNNTIEEFIIFKLIPEKCLCCPWLVTLRCILGYKQLNK